MCVGCVCVPMKLNSSSNRCVQTFRSIISQSNRLFDAFVKHLSVKFEKLKCAGNESDLIWNHFTSQFPDLGPHANRLADRRKRRKMAAALTRHALTFRTKMQIGKWKCQHAANTSLIKFKSIVFDANTRKTKHTIDENR